MDEFKKLGPFDFKEYIPYEKELEKVAKSPENLKFGMKILCFADTHGYFSFGKYRLEEELDRVGDFDICLLLGDITHHELCRICDCISERKILGVLGNHDRVGTLAEFGICDLHRRVKNICGVTFAGIGGAFRYKLDEGYLAHTQYESILYADELPPSHVLITHDTAFNPIGARHGHEGLVGISKYIYEKPPVHHLHGHIHKPGEDRYSNGTMRHCIHGCTVVEI